MAFTPEEQAILSQLAYADIKTSETSPATLYSTLDEKKTWLTKELGEGYTDALENLIRKVEGEDYTIVRSVNDDANTGFVAFAVADPNNDVTVVCRGSEDLSQLAHNANSQKDLHTDIQLGLEKETDQQQEMEKFMDDLEKQGYDGYYFTGHSLGGNLAIHGAIHVGDPDKVKGVSTYNAPGFNSQYWNIYDMRIRRIKGKITNYENEYDIVSDIFRKPGETVYVESTKADQLNHSICDFKLKNKGFTKANGKGLRNIPINILFDVDIGKYWAYSVVGTYIYSRITGSALTGYRDFSRSALKTMTDAARETEEEAWWRVDRWDCWYRLDNAFGGNVMEFQRLTGNVDAYYRKVIDMNDASVADIEKIFEKVYDLDDTYSAKIRSGVSQLEGQVLNKLRQLADSVNPGVR